MQRSGENFCWRRMPGVRRLLYAKKLVKASRLGGVARKPKLG